MDVFRPSWPLATPRPLTVQPPPASSPYTKVENLFDNFDDNSLDVGKFYSFANPGSTIQETTQQTVITVDNSAASVYAGLVAQSPSYFSLIESSIFLQVSSYPTQSANTEIALVLDNDSFTRVVITSINGTWYARYRDNFYPDTTHASYTGVDPWLKISHTAGVVHWWHSADGLSWTEIGTGVTMSGPWPGKVGPSLQFGHFASDISSNTCKFDNLNVAPAAVGQTITGKLLLTGVGT